MPFPEPEPVRTEAQLLTELTLLRDKVEDGKKSRSSLKKDNEIVHEPAALTQAIFEIVRDPLLILDANFCVQKANRSFYRAFNLSKEATENRRIYDLENGQWSIAELHRLLEEIILQDNGFDDFEIEHEFKHIGNRTLLFNARRLEQGSGRSSLILLAIKDITGQQAVEAGPTANND